MRLFFVGFYKSVLGFLMPKLISDGEEVFYASSEAQAFKILDKYDFDYVFVDIDNVNFDIVNFMNKHSTKYNVKWIFYSYLYEENFIKYLKNLGLRAFLSKNIHPECLYIKIRCMLHNNDEDFLVFRRKYYRVDVEPNDRTVVRIWLPTVKHPIIGKLNQISMIGAQIRLIYAAELELIRKNQYLSRALFKMNGRSVEVSGKVIHRSVEKGVVLMFNELNSFAHEYISRFIYGKMEKYLEVLTEEKEELVKVHV